MTNESKPAAGGVSRVWVRFVTTGSLAVMMTVRTAHADWNTYASTWQYWREIEIQAAKVSGTADLTDFPVLISLSNDWLRTTANGGHVTRSDGGDIVFSSQDGSVDLDHEVESYDGTLGMLDAWVRVPALDHDDNTTIMMWYGDEAAYDRAATNVWDANYVVVQHMDDEPDSSSVADSTANDNDGSKGAAGEPTEVDAQVDEGQEFDGDDYVSVGADASVDITGDITLETWVKTSASGSEQRLVDRGTVYHISLYDGGTATPRFTLYHATPGNQVLEASTVDWDDGNWHHMAGVKDGTTMYIYCDGIQTTNRSCEATIYTTAGKYLGIGTALNSSGDPYAIYLIGAMDEVRVSNSARNADWIKTEYDNMNDPDTFYSVGVEQTVPARGTLFLLR